MLPSIKRFTDKDALGGLLGKSTKEMTAVDERTFRIVLSEPFAMMLKALAKSASVPLFVMPRRVAETPVSQQISDTTGSGPFIFKKDEWKPGEKVVYVRNPDYKPRAEPPSGLAGGKVAKVDRVEWVSIPDNQTAINALISGEVDMIEAPAHDLLPVLEKDKNVEITVPDTLGSPTCCASTGSSRRSTTCAIVAPPHLPSTRRTSCRPPSAINATTRSARRCSAAARRSRTRPAWKACGIAVRRVEALLKELGYDGTPDRRAAIDRCANLVNMAPVAKTLLERGGFKVDMQSMDWQTLVARRTKKDRSPRAAGTSP